MAEYFQKCDQCKGARTVPRKVERRLGGMIRKIGTETDEKCGKCVGQGRLLTAAGRGIAEIVKHVMAKGN